VDKAGKIDNEAAVAAVGGSAKEEKATPSAAVEPAPFFEAARQHLEQMLSLWSWEDDVEFLGLSWVEFQ